jgi:hypothetical protein
MATHTDMEALPGVGPATATKLTDAGYDSYGGLAIASPREVVAATDIGDGTATDIIAASREAAGVGASKAELRSVNTATGSENSRPASKPSTNSSAAVSKPSR